MDRFVVSIDGRERNSIVIRSTELFLLILIFSAFDVEVNEIMFPNRLEDSPETTTPGHSFSG